MRKKLLRHTARAKPMHLSSATTIGDLIKAQMDK